MPITANADIGALQNAGLEVSNRVDHHGFAVEIEALADAA